MSSGKARKGAQESQFTTQQEEDLRSLKQRTSILISCSGHEMLGWDQSIVKEVIKDIKPLTIFHKNEKQ